MKKKYHITLLFIVSIMIFAACDNGGDCNINNVAYYRSTFYKMPANDDEKEEKYQFPEVINISLIVNGKDSTIVNHITQTTEVALPMCYTQECDTVVLHIGETVTDSLFVQHTNIPMFLSMDCGTAMFHNITDIRHTENYIDSIAIIHPFVDFDAHENVKIYIIE
ncbi:MAG: hypothetical protein IJA04_03295 [Bacteroidaceae bacterium]|nr:hypothetical protein [Bacteroidaceae bacterium]